jgi:hypothetical protein
MVSGLREAIGVPAHFGPCFYLLLNIMMRSSPACSRKNICAIYDILRLCIHIHTVLSKANSGSKGEKRRLRLCYVNQTASLLELCLYGFWPE